MNHAFGMEGSPGPLEAGVDLAVRATALLAVALVAWRAVGRRRPLIGSAIGQGALLALLLLPASAWLVPSLPIPLLRAEPAASARTLEDRPVAIEESTSGREILGLENPASDGVVSSPTAVGPTPPLVAIKPSKVRTEGGPAARNPWSWRTIDPASAVVATYAFVGLAMLARLLGSLAGVARVRRSSVAVDDPSWVEALDRLKVRLGIRRPVALARSGRVGVPVVVGWLRPMILLPESGEVGVGDPIEHAEAILLHELAHVRRGDYAWNVLLRLVEALYWPHPLAWLLGRAVAESRERACDAFCVHQLGGPSAYREALLAMAEGLARRPGLAPGLAMAGRSRLGRRVLEIDRGRPEPHCLPRWPSRLAVLALTLASTAIVGPAQITRAEPQPVPVPAPVVILPQEPKKEAPAAKAAPVGKVFRLRVVAAETGQPVPRADVRVWMGLRRGDDWRQTDEEGRIELVYATGPDDPDVGVDIWGDGFAQQRLHWGDDPKVPVPDEVIVKLQPGESLGGLVQDEEGRPVAGAVVYLWSHNYKRKDPAEVLYDLRAVTGPDGRWHTGGAPQTTGDLISLYITHPDFISDRKYAARREVPTIEDLRAAKAVSVMKKGVPIEGRVLGTDGKPVAGALVISTESEQNLSGSGLNEFAVRTDAEGRFRTGQVKAGKWHLVVKAKGHAPAARQFQVGAAIPSEQIRLEPAHSFRARVVDPEGKPIAGAFVNIDEWQRYRCLGIYMFSDADGRVRWDDAPGDELRINVDHPTHLGLFMHPARAGSDLVFTIKPSLAISGIVRDAQTKKVVEVATIEYGAIEAQTGEVATWRKPPEIGWVWYSRGQLTARFAVEAEAYKIRILADGYPPFVSRAFRRDEQAVTHYDVNLAPGSGGGPLATVLRPDGRPLAGARVYRARSRNTFNIRSEKMSGEIIGNELKTGADGTFLIPTETDPGLVLVLADDCFLIAGPEDFAKSPRLTARPYARVEGRYLIGDRPGVDKPIKLLGILQVAPSSNGTVIDEQSATTDAEGRFAFAKVIPMPRLWIGRQAPSESYGRIWALGESVLVEDGRTTVITIGGKGRPVVGRVEPPQGWDRPVDFTDRGLVRIETNGPNKPYPLELLRGKTSLDDDGWLRWARTWPDSPEGQAYARSRVGGNVALAPDGSFRIDDVPPGEYRVEISVNELWQGRDRGPFASTARVITIPPIPGGRSDRPLDLGAIRLRARTDAPARVGDPAPAFEVTTLDGKKLAIPGDFPGKFLLLDLGTMWDDQSRLQVVRMNDLAARFGKDARFAMLSLLMAADGPESRAFVAEKGETWPQAVVGPVSNPISEGYGIESNQFPSAILIGPDGRIVARDLSYQKIGEAIAGALGIQEPATKP